MQDSFKVDADLLWTAAAPRFAAAGGELAAALAELRSVLADCAEMCGDDDPGRAFAANYEPKSRLIDEAMGFASRGVAAVGEAVRASADNFSGLEEANVQALQRINPEP